MSLKGVYTALSGSIAQGLKMDTIANNLANVNTPAFKKDQQVFQEYLTANEKPPTVIQVPKIPASIESFYDMQGGDKSYVDSQGTYTVFEQGGLKATGNSLDVAIDGDGFFEVATPTGVKLTRSGNFTLDGNGQVVTKEGFPLLKLGADGADPSMRTIKMLGQGSITITDSGELLEGEQLLGKLSVVKVSNLDGLKKTGNSLYDFKENQPSEVISIQNPSLKQGFLETSNVNIVQEMTDMIQTQRAFESTQKAISAFDSMTDKLV
ncbi:MAG TPA: flagellar basal-body rod protein FlgF, partial [Pseudobdellovibrionaceae bacterium]|nr:flagellar basal-body rod protein FlgF [Pseudobdellovibrionaceae bacterium]